MLYGTAGGIDLATFQYLNTQAGIWSINTNDWTINRLYDGNNTIISDGYIYHPNGCIINDGIIYLVEFRLDGTGAFGMYNIETSEFIYNSTLLNIQGDGIIYSEPYFFMTAYSAGQLLAYNSKKEDSKFEVVLSDLATGDGSNGAQDLCLGPNNVLAIPNQGQTTIYFVKFDIDDDSDESKAAHSQSMMFGGLIIMLLYQIHV